MEYTKFRDHIVGELREHPEGFTWEQIKKRLGLPYNRPCPEWVRRMEREAGLKRVPGSGRALLWRVER